MLVQIMTSRDKFGLVWLLLQWNLTFPVEISLKEVHLLSSRPPTEGGWDIPVEMYDRDEFILVLVRGLSESETALWKLSLVPLLRAKVKSLLEQM